MAAAPEELLGQGAFLTEPFSPSIFLDLPPTPRPDGDGDGEDPAPSDDLVLPFISRMLMEEDIDDKFFYQYTDHPALLTAQEPFAQILSDATTAFSSDAATTTSSGSVSATANTDGGGAFTLSSSSSEAPAFTNATWPYDPAELSQLLLSTPSPDMGVRLDSSDANAFFLPGQDGGRAGFHQIEDEASAFLNGGGTAIQSWEFLDGTEEETDTTITNTLPTGATFFSGQNRVEMDMLNLAFLKGMEEAKKFLPTNNSLLIDLDPTSGEHLPIDSDLSRVFAAGQVKKRQVVDGTSMFQESDNGRGRKNRHNWEDLEAETGRSSKLLVPEPEETGKMVDKVIADAYVLCLDKMKGLCVTVGSEAEKNSRKENGKSAQDRRSSNEAVDLRTLLIHCAQAVSMDDRQNATELLRQIRQHSSPRGDANQRLAHCFAEGLEARLAGTGSQVYRSLVRKHTSVMEFLKAYQLYLAACCFQMTAYSFSNITITKAIAGRKKVHIVDYGMQYGFQWPTLLAHLAKWEGGPPELRITAIHLPQPGFRPAARIKETGRRLSNFARECGMPFKFRSIVAKWETVRVDDLKIDPDEVLIVNSIIHFGNLMDEGVDIHSPSPRDVVLSNIRKMRPDVFILCVANGSCAPFFVTRFREALFYYSAMFDMLDATASRDNDQCLLVERDIIGRCALNVIACEGSDRVERPEAYKQWQVRNHRAGLRQRPLDPDTVKKLREKVKNQYHKDFVIDVDHQWFLQGWKGRILYAMLTWVADESISEL